MINLISNEESLAFKSDAWQAFENFKSYVVEQANARFAGREVELSDEFFRNDVFIMTDETCEKYYGAERGQSDELLEAYASGVKRIKITEFFLTERLVLCFDWEMVED